jgi:hypothetical protein
MVLIWAPPGNPQTGDLCAGLNEYNTARGPLGNIFLLANAIIFYFILGLMIITYAILFYYRDEPRLKSRGIFLSMVTGFNLLILLVGVCLKRTALMMTPQGQTQMACTVHAWIAVSLTPLQTGTSLSRLIKLLHQARYARGVRKMDHIINNQNDDTESILSETNTIYVKTKSSIQDACNNLKWAYNIIILSFGFGENAKRLEANRNVTNSQPTSPTSLQANVEALQLSRAALSTSGTVLLLCVLYIPTLICILILYGTADVFKGQCISCDIFGETMIIMVGSYIITLLLRIRLAILVKNEPDPDGIIKEMKIGSVIVLSTIFITIIMLWVDPGYLDYWHVVAWEWIFACGLFMYWIGSVPLQIYFALQERWIREKNNSSATDPSSRHHTSRILEYDSIQDALKNEVIFHRFEEFAEKNFCSESVHFLWDAIQWKDRFERKTVHWRFVKAKAIVQTYIVEYSVLQINIPSSMRVPVEKIIEHASTSTNMAMDQIPHHLFDECVQEVIHLLKLNLWAKFVKSGGTIEPENDNELIEAREAHMSVTRQVSNV